MTRGPKSNGAPRMREGLRVPQTVTADEGNPTTGSGEREPLVRRRAIARALNWLTVVLLVLLVAMAVNLFGQSFGLWGTHTRTVTIICERHDDGTAKCMSQPIRVEDER